MDVEVRGISGRTVTVTLIAQEDNGRQRSTYAGTYTVRDGEIVTGRMRLIARNKM